MRQKIYTEVLNSYIECAAWAEECEDVTKDFLKRAKTDVKAFLDSIPDVLLECALKENDATHLGHDFWLTRQGHGAGFWDGDYSKFVGKDLTELAKAQGEVYTDKWGSKLRLI